MPGTSIQRKSLNEIEEKVSLNIQNPICFFSKVPIGFDFVRVLDMYFKIHKVFNFDFNKKVKPVMTLVDNFVFKFPFTTNQSITPTIQSVANKLFEA